MDPGVLPRQASCTCVHACVVKVHGCNVFVDSRSSGDVIHNFTAAQAHTKTHTSTHYLAISDSVELLEAAADSQPEAWLLDFSS